MSRHRPATRIAGGCSIVHGLLILFGNVRFENYPAGLSIGVVFILIGLWLAFFAQRVDDKYWVSQQPQMAHRLLIWGLGLLLVWRVFWKVPPLLFEEPHRDFFMGGIMLMTLGGSFVLIYAWLLVSGGVGKRV